MQLKSRRIISTIGISTATVGCALTLAVTGAFGRSSPMRSHSIAATHTFLGTRGLNRLSRDSNLPSDVSEAVEQLATFDNSSPSAAVARVQLARQGTSEESTVYTFTDDRGNECVVVVGLSSFCNPDGGTPVAGINWSIGGGDSQNPDRLIAIYSNEVNAVTLSVDGTSVPVEMANSIAYAEFPASSQNATVTVTYADGSSNTIPTNLVAPTTG